MPLSGTPDNNKYGSQTGITSQRLKICPVDNHEQRNVY